MMLTESAKTGTASMRGCSETVACIALLLASCVSSHAANHLDTPTVVADPRADIGDLFAWLSGDGQRLNLVMTIVAPTFSDQVTYSFHVGSGARFGHTTGSVSLKCRVEHEAEVDCTLDETDRATGDASTSNGLVSHKKRFRIFAGLRDDPFFNNVKGSRDAYNVAHAALKQGVPFDAAGCAELGRPTSERILRSWTQTDNGPGMNFLAGWAASALVISLDLEAIASRGRMLAVWASTTKAGVQLDRMGRPLTENALLGTLSPEEEANALKEAFNRVSPADGARFVPQITTGLQLYDAFDGVCGNQFASDISSESRSRYRRLAELLADDRIWIDATSSKCEQFMAVELRHVSKDQKHAGDCGGRTLTSDAVDAYRSLLVSGRIDSVSDGVTHDDQKHSLDDFPFVAPPAAAHRR